MAQEKMEIKIPQNSEKIIDDNYIIETRKQQGRLDLSDDDVEFMELMQELKKFINPKLLKN